MRQIGAIDSEQEAQQFASYLVTQGIDAHAELDDGAWAIWVRDEADLDEAKQALKEFREDPSNARYQGSEQAAESILRDQAEKRQQVQKNVVQMRGRWSRGASRKAPLTVLLIAACIGLFIVTRFSSVDLSVIVDRLMLAGPTDQGTGLAAFRDVLRGQVWRLITPIFLHGSVMHLAFNMYVLYVFGGQIEDRKGSWRLLLLILVIAALSNAVQGFFRGPNFLGMSGVDYGLFGYIWMKTLYAPYEGLYVDKVTVFMLVGWFFACWFGLIPNIANLAHAAGLAAGVAISYVAIWLPTGK